MTGTTSGKTLETGCEHAIDFHFRDHRTAAFALDDYIYTLRKTPSGKAGAR